MHPDLLIADVRLRGGNGDDLAHLAEAMGIPVLLMSGEPAAIEQHINNTDFLEKPLHLSALQALLRS